MEFSPLGIEGSWLAQSPLWKDERGYFREWFKPGEFEFASGRNFEAMQGNISKSSKGTVRGIHYSLALGGQAKWVTCVTGAIRDFVIDIRLNSSTYGQWVEVNLTAESGKAIFIKEGLGHAFVSLEDNTVVSYLVSSVYSPQDEYDINPLDSDLAINWKINVSDLHISDKDRVAPTLRQRKEEGKLPNFSSSPI